jgi:hypothetical protein
MTIADVTHIADGTKVIFTSNLGPKDKEYEGILRKGEFRTKSGNYCYVVAQPYNDSFGMGNITSIRPV